MILITAVSVVPYLMLRAAGILEEALQSCQQLRPGQILLSLHEGLKLLLYEASRIDSAQS